MAALMTVGRARARTGGERDTDRIGWRRPRRIFQCLDRLYERSQRERCSWLCAESVSTVMTMCRAHRRTAPSAVLVERRVAVDVPQLIVTDSKRAFGTAAGAWRSRFALPVIAVAGSNGKTTVTQMIASILSAEYGEKNRLATQGNLNNDIGVPLMLWQLSKQHRAAVFELGMNHPGEIAYLAQLVQPTVALVNNAQREHQEFMQSVEATAP